MPWILVAAGLVIVWVLFGRGRGTGRRYLKGDACIAIEPQPGPPGYKVTVAPDHIVKGRGASVDWDIVDTAGQHPVEITFRGPDPLRNPPHKNVPDHHRIHAVVHGDSAHAPDGHNKYEVRVDGTVAVDPDLEVRGG